MMSSTITLLSPVVLATVERESRAASRVVPAWSGPCIDYRTLSFCEYERGLGKALGKNLPRP